MKNHKLKFYSSQEELDEAELKRMREMTPEERMREMRLHINLAYGLHGFDPNNLPTKHTLTFIYPPRK